MLRHGNYHHRGIALFVVCALLFCAAGGTYSWFVLGSGLRFPDEVDYLVLARHLATLDGFTLDGAIPTALRPPGYPALLAPLIALFDSVHFLRVAQFAMIAVAAWLLGCALEQSGTIERWRGGTLILLGVLCYPVLVYTAGTLFPQTVMLLLLAVLVLSISAWPTGNRPAFAIGLVSAVLVLVSPTALAVLPTLLLLACLDSRWTRRHVLLMLLATALVFSGWCMRNLISIGEPILFSENLAFNIDNAVLAMEPAAAETDRTPKSAIGYGFERLAQYASDPLAYIRRLGEFFAWHNHLQVDSEASAMRDLVMFVSYNTLLALVLLRMLLIRSLPLSRAEYTTLALYVATALFHALVIPRIRYRLPFDFLLLLPVATLTVHLWRRAVVRRNALSVEASVERP